MRPVVKRKESREQRVENRALESSRLLSAL
jgi:hypothetical protein